MSCRWTLNVGGLPDTWLDTSGGLAVYVDLAREGRKDEFRWFARSQGVPDERVEALWRSVLARL